MEENLQEIISMSCEHFVDVPLKCKQRLAKEIADHYRKFIEWLINMPDSPYYISNIDSENIDKLYNYYRDNVLKK